MKRVALNLPTPTTFTFFSEEPFAPSLATTFSLATRLFRKRVISAKASTLFSLVRLLVLGWLLEASQWGYNDSLFDRARRSIVNGESEHFISSQGEKT